MVFKVAQQDRTELKRVQTAFRRLPRDVKNDFRRYQRASVNPIWREEMADKAGSSRLNQAVFGSGSRVKAGAPMVLTAGTSGRALSGGLVPNQYARHVEFGSNRRNNYTTYMRKGHKVTRRAGRGMPQYRRGGHVVYPAFTRAHPRIVKLHVQTLVRRIYQALGD